MEIEVTPCPDTPGCFCVRFNNKSFCLSPAEFLDLLGKMKAALSRTTAS